MDPCTNIHQYYITADNRDQIQMNWLWEWPNRLWWIPPEVKVCWCISKSQHIISLLVSWKAQSAQTDPGESAYIYLLRLFLFFSSSNLKREQGKGVKAGSNREPTAYKHPKEQHTLHVCCGTVAARQLKPHQWGTEHFPRMTLYFVGHNSVDVIVRNAENDPGINNKKHIIVKSCFFCKAPIQKNS